MLTLLLPLLGTGCGPGHQATITPRSELSLSEQTLDFGEVPFGTASQQELTVTNAGDAQLQMTLVVDGTGFSTSNSSVSVGAGDSLALSVTYQPSGRDDSIGLLTLTYDGIEQDVELVGATDPDGDDDGFEHDGLSGTTGSTADCDDSDPTIYPGATEVWYDAVDQDCAGDDDYDADADGYRSDEHGGDDCDDTTSAAYPGGAEVWYDGVDGDCDGASDYDMDADGYDSDEYDGDDCDDDNPRISPEATEVWYDDVDSDCSGGSDHDADGDGVDAASTIGTDCDDDVAGTYPGAVELDDLVDQDCDLLTDEDFVSVGDLVVTELMLDPTVATVEAGQYVEIYNASARDVAVAGWEISSSSGSGIALTELILGPSEVGVLCAEDNLSANGGVASCDGEWAQAFSFTPTDDAVTLSIGGFEVDVVDWNVTWPVVEGTTLSLDPGSWDASDNDLSARWCTSSSTSETGDLGTPGALNDACVF